MPSTDHSWTDDRAELAKQKYLEGFSASQIAKILGGVSRNAVIGKLHRMGALPQGRPCTARPGRTSPATLRVAARQSIPVRVRTFDVGPAEPVAPPQPAPEPAPVPAEAKALRICDPGFGGCRWPISDDGADSLFCCAPKKPGSFWCAAHGALGYDLRPRKPLKVGMAA